MTERDCKYFYIYKIVLKQSANQFLAEPTHEQMNYQE